MHKVSITLDVSKFDKSKIVDRKFKTQAGVEVTQKEYKIELIPRKEVKTVKETDTYKLDNTHFVVQQQTKEERAARAPAVYVGQGFTFINKESTTSNQDSGVEYPNDDINAEDIPF